jgi:RNA polymerase sigma-70 factor (ECF subfamily)
LRSLGKTDAQLFALVALEGYSIADAAGLLNLSAPAAQTRLHRIRIKLRAQLGDQRSEDQSADGGVR